jgi:hypothetical protein
MQTKVIVLYRLKQGVSLREYCDWSLQVDQRLTSAQPAVNRFEPYVAIGGEGGGEQYTIFEDLEVETWEEWQRTLATAEMKPVVEGWPKLADESSLVIVYGKRVVL